MRLLKRGVNHLRPLNMQMLAFKCGRHARKRTAPDGEEFVCYFVTLVVRKKHPITLGFVRVAAGDYVDQQPSVRKAIECRLHSRRQTRRHHSRPHRHQKFQLVRYGNKGGSHNPGVLSRISCRKQHSFITELSTCLSNLLEICMVGLPHLLGRAEITPIALCRNKPEKFHRLDVSPDLHCPESERVNRILST